MKHAYLIIAHNEFEVLDRLLKALDDERNDIYIHFDAKIATCPICETLRAGLYVLTNRVTIHWGDVSMIRAELLLFGEAHRRGEYSYYHLISGVDMPLRTQNEIHHFFETHAGLEFIGYFQQDMKAQLTHKVQRYYLFSTHLRESKGWRKLIRSLFIRLQKIVGIKRNRNILFKKGTQWVSVTSDFVEYILSRQSQLLEMYNRTYCSDEIFIQTLCWNSSFRNRLFDLSDEGHGCLRMINWENNVLMDWEAKDYEKLINSDALFARKFSSRHLEVVDKLLKKIV